MKHFIDLVEIHVESGRGGDGIVAWRREKFVPFGGPAGGDGGKGGSIFLQADNSVNTLLSFRYKNIFKANDGKNGGGSNKSGHSAEDIIIKVPLGTNIYKKQNNEKILIGDLKNHNQEFLVARGGKGGRGNQHFATATRQAPHFCEPGEDGETYDLILELKLIADIGIIGLPNAGKSSLISRLSACKPKIADYPFTTLVPNLGILKLPDNRSITIADIPGLIKGASEGHGLGFQFLRHAERTKALIHLVDCLIQDLEIIKENIKIIEDELKAYKESFNKKERILVFNKIDSCEEEFLEELKKTYPESLFISAITGEGLDKLIAYIQGFDFKEEEILIIPFQENENENENFIIDFEKESRVFKIKSLKVEALLRVVNFQSFDSVNNLYIQLKKLGVLNELERLGIQSGDTVLIGNKEMIWSEFAENNLI